MHGKEALLGKERYSLKMAIFSCQEGPSFIFFHDVEFLPAQRSEEESLCSLYGEAKSNKNSTGEWNRSLQYTTIRLSLRRGMYW